MVKCLVTKLNGSVDNPNLKKEGEIDFTITPDTESATLRFCIKNGKEGSKLYLPNNEKILSCDSPSFSNASEAKLYSWAYYFNAALSMKTKFALNNKYFATYLSIECLEGSAKSNIKLSDLTYMNSLNSFNLKIDFEGEIKDFANMPLLESISAESTKLHGSLRDFLQSENLKAIYLGCPLVKGDIDELAEHPNLSIIWTTTPNTKGDASLLGKKVHTLYTDSSNSKISWKHERSEDSTIIGISAYMGEDIDAMLINQAKCIVGENKKISVLGTRTSASDTAVATLQSKGYTVSIVQI